MTDESPAAAPALHRQLELLQELADLVRRQDDSRQAAQAETRRLRLAIDEAVTRLSALVSGQCASRAELQAVIERLRTAAEHDDPGDTERTFQPRSRWPGEET